jgi:endonuclease/exonuclease/phosphatase family metal-dependent hydrolase
MRDRRCSAAVFGMLALLLAAPCLAAETVRVATFNVLNYLIMDRRIDDRFRPSFPKPEREKAGLRTVIRSVQPDVLALQEMGPAPFLEELRQDLAREGLEYAYSYLLEAADAERHVAVLSRLPFAQVVPHAGIEITYFGEREEVKRGMLEITFDAPGGQWTLFALHLKSRLTDRPDDPMSAQRRLLEARALRDRVLARFPDPAAARFVVAGDFNDTKDSKPLAAFLRRGERTILHIVPTTDSRGEPWTHRYAPADSMARVDFILVSPLLRPAVAGDRGVVFDGEGALTGSDHRLVFLDLDLAARPEDKPAPPAGK